MLVQDLADMYPDTPFDVVLTELVANALDAKASEISISWDSTEHVLIVADDGNGMDMEAFEQYHDFAAELKPRGAGIGFAGVGAKISFNIARQVITETRCAGGVNGSDWRWHDDGSLRWRPIRSNQLTTDGTRVEVRFRLDLFTLGIDDEYLVRVLKRHYLPLFIDEFVRSYTAIGLYPNRPQFIVNGSPVSCDGLSEVAALSHHVDFQVGAGALAVGWGAIGISDRDYPVGSHAYGVLLCTHGKVIKPELFGLSTGTLGPRFFGIVEIPNLIEYLTTSKSDLKGGPGRVRGLNRLLDPVRQEMKAFLADQGIAVAEQRRDQLSAKLERELSRLVPRLHELRDFDGLLRRSRAIRKNDAGNLLTSEFKNKRDGDATAAVSPSGTAETANGKSGSSRQSDEDGKTRAKRQRSRRNQGPRVAFEEHPNRGETAWLDSNTIVINIGHAAYRQRISQDQAKFTYCMFAIGVALDKADLAQSDDGLSYVDKFISAWGQS